MKRACIVGIIIFMNLFLVSATTTIIYSTPTSLDKDSTNLIVHYEIDNTNGNAGSKGVSITGLPKFLSYSGGSISYGANTTVSGDLTLSFNIPSDTFGSFENYIIIDEETLTIPITILEEPTSGCRLIELPHTTNFRIQKDEIMASSQIRIKVSTECPTLSMSVIEKKQMSKPMFLQGSSGDIEPGGEFSFTIGIDAVDVSKGPYSNTYIVSGDSGDEVYQKSIDLFVDVTAGTNPVGEDSFDNLPTCTMESDMVLNNTYSLFCNNNNPLIYLDIPYNEFFEGLTVPKSGDDFEYVIKPVKTGLTEFRVLFKFLGLVPIGPAFVKEVRIMQGSVPIQGTTLEVLFYQNGEKKQIQDLFPGTTIILVKDNNTNSIVPSFIAYLNGNAISNNSFNIISDKEYELLVDAPGYLTSTLNISVNQTPIDITISPDKQVYVVGESINITTNTTSSVLLDGYIITFPYTFQSPGTKLLEVIKNGHLQLNKTLEVKEKIYMTTSSPIYEDWKKGKKVVAELNQNTSWEIFHNGVLVKTGNGNRVEFKIEDVGLWEIKYEGIIIHSKTIVDSSWFKDKWEEYKKSYWLWGVVVVLVLIIGYYLFKDKETQEEGFSFQPTQVNE